MFHRLRILERLDQGDIRTAGELDNIGHRTALDGIIEPLD